MAFLGDRKPVCLAPETFLSLEVVFNGELRLMRGRSDYAVWCGDRSLSSHQIAIEAKSFGNASHGFAQYLGYMGMVHAIRKAEKKLNAAVFGCCSDSHHFTFIRIDNESRYSFYDYHWGYGDELSLNEIEERKIYTTPRTSPVRARRIQDNKKHGKAYYVRFGSEERVMSLFPVPLLNEQQHHEASQIVSNRTFFCQLCLQLRQFWHFGLRPYSMMFPSGGWFFCNSACNCC